MRVLLSAEDVVRARSPHLAAAMESLKSVAAETMSGSEVALSKLRLRQMHGHGAAGLSATGADPRKVDALASWWESDLFTEHERACLDLAEQFVLAVDGVRQAHIDALMPAWTEQEVYDFIMVLYVEDLSSRAELVLDAVLGGSEEPSVVSESGE